MIVIPAIDLKEGKCVRLLQGRMDQETVFSDDPAAMAAKWAGLGAELIHVVDLDGAIHKQPRNLSAIQSILSAFTAMGVVSVGPTHCTGEKAQALFQNGYGDQYLSISAGRRLVV